MTDSVCKSVAERFSQEWRQTVDELRRTLFHQEMTAVERTALDTRPPSTPDRERIAESLHQPAARPQRQHGTCDATPRLPIRPIVSKIDLMRSIFGADRSKDLGLPHTADVILDDAGLDRIESAPRLEDV